MKNKYKRSDVNLIHQLSSQDAFETELASRPNPRSEALLALSLAYMYFKYRVLDTNTVCKVRRFLGLKRYFTCNLDEIGLVLS